MIYTIKHFDTPLLKFSADENSNVPKLEIICITEENKHLLPLDMEITSDSVYRCLRHRTILKNRAYVHNFLLVCDLSINRPMNIISVSRGLSLDDCYWGVEDGFDGT